ncbi:hypothetical protein K1719_029903 [Acacia pycnantha]|nr:hypothetical protein K1719_029903 [Acacia pycnantha]
MERQGDQPKEGDSVLMLQNEKAKENSALLPSHLAYQRNQISYRSKLLEKEEEIFSQELEDQMKEWLCEEKEISTPLTEEQKILLDSLPKLNMSDERLMSLCRPWKDALILTLLGKSANLEMMKDRIAWILISKSFELIDLPNNYFLFKTGNRDLRLRLLFDGPWVIQGHYLAVQRWSPNFNPYKKCPLVRNAEENSSEVSQPIVNTSHASKNPSYSHAQLKPLVSVPGINSDEQFGSWMIAKRNSRKRIHIVEPEKKVGKMPENNKSNGKGKKSASGSRFDVLQDVEDRTFSKGVDCLRKTEVATTTWRRKEGETLPSIKEGVVGSKKREKSVIGSLKSGKPLIESSKSGTKEDVVGHIEKEKLNLDADGKCSLVIGETQLESSTVREKKEKVMKAKEKEGKATNALVGQPQREGAGRGEKKNFEEKDLVPCNLDIVNSSTITIKNGKNDDVDRGAEDSEVVPPSLHHDELIEHIADDADFTEGQESLVAETQFEMGKDLDSGHANTDPVRDQDHDVALMEQNQLSHDQWDPNEDIAPDFLEDNGSIVPETQPLHLNGGDID